MIPKLVEQMLSLKANSLFKLFKALSILLFYLLDRVLLAAIAFCHPFFKTKA